MAWPTTTPTRKWLLAKALPKVYGDRVTAELTGEGGGPIETQDLSVRELAHRMLFSLTLGLRAQEKEEREGPGAVL
jgi:hypothetical protein